MRKALTIMKLEDKANATGRRYIQGKSFYISSASVRIDRILLYLVVACLIVWRKKQKRKEKRTGEEEDKFQEGSKSWNE